MAENKKYFYLKFRENYFEQDQIKVIESMKNGFEYSLILLKLYLKSLKWDGQLRINERIPYNSDKIDLLSGVLGHDPANVMHAINIAKDLQIMDVLTTGEMFMSDIQNLIGHNSSEGERKLKYRNEIKERDKIGTLSQNRPPEIEIELELKKELELNLDINALSNETANIKIEKPKKESFKRPELTEVIDELKAIDQWEGLPDGKTSEGFGQSFWEFYESKGWMVGKNSMKNWKMALSRALREWGKK